MRYTQSPLYADVDPTGRTKLLFGGYEPDPDEGYPTVQLAKMLDGCIVDLYGRPVIRPALLQLLFERHWSKVSMLAHKIHDEER